jgi:nicotinate-nucleotide adenylyltransferase
LKIGILGGTFDPVHRGHRYVATEILEIADLERVIFMVSKSPPHKEKATISSPFHRYAMAVIEVLKSKRLHASQLELHRTGPSYTIDTLRLFSSRQPRDQICFIAGSDSLREIHAWKDCDKLFEDYSFVFVQRPGAEVDLGGAGLPAELRRWIREVRKGDKPTIQPGRSYLISLDSPPVSSTAIREMIASGDSLPEGWVSPGVLLYIQKYHLYEQNRSHSEKSLRGD